MVQLLLGRRHACPVCLSSSSSVLPDLRAIVRFVCCCSRFGPVRTLAAVTIRAPVNVFVSQINHAHDSLGGSLASYDGGPGARNFQRLSNTSSRGIRRTRAIHPTSGRTLVLRCIAAPNSG